MIRLNAFLEVINVEDKTKVLQLAKELVTQSIKEDGCVAYDIFESATRDSVLMFCETWKDAKTLEIHAKSEHFVKLIPELEKLAKLKLEQFTF